MFKSIKQFFSLFRRETPTTMAQAALAEHERELLKSQETVAFYQHDVNYRLERIAALKLMLEDTTGFKLREEPTPEPVTKRQRGQRVTVEAVTKPADVNFAHAARAMGDRTSVTLTFPQHWEEKVTQIIDYDTPNERWDETGALCVWSYEEVNYGELGFLSKLRDAGIAYTSEWGAGSEYGPGAEHHRFHPDGTEQNIRIYNSDRNPELNSLLELIDNPAQLRMYILQHRNLTTPLPWDNQVEYGKLYLAKKLVGL